MFCASYHFLLFFSKDIVLPTSVEFLDANDRVRYNYSGRCVMFVGVKNGAYFTKTYVKPVLVHIKEAIKFSVPKSDDLKNSCMDLSVAAYISFLRTRKNLF